MTLGNLTTPVSTTGVRSGGKSIAFDHESDSDSIEPLGQRCPGSSIEALGTNSSIGLRQG
jgi:hypothetical protein